MGVILESLLKVAAEKKKHQEVREIKSVEQKARVESSLLEVTDLKSNLARLGVKGE